MTRRLASQDREDAYASLRDYQQVFERTSVKYTGTESPLALSYSAEVGAAEPPGYIGFAGFIAANTAGMATVGLNVGTTRMTQSLAVDASWRRFGLAVERSGASLVQASLEVAGATSANLWGVVLDRFLVPPAILASAAASGRDVDLRTLNEWHLAPETFYFDHGLSGTVAPTNVGDLQVSRGKLIRVKKCSYCGRYLPLDPDRLGQLSFHAHRAKVSRHQNECRACKTWRINGTFNPLRTVDQLNESSLITRERKLLLREPMILQKIKNRDGEGLKSQVWRRFGKVCFRCKQPLRLASVQLDHTRPLAYLWPIDEHATSLCEMCNNSKHDAFPVDFYTQDQLVELSALCGLPYEALIERRVNPVMLDRILHEIVDFSEAWGPRVFESVARRAALVEDGLDLYAHLGEASEDALQALLERAAERPDAVID